MKRRKIKRLERTAYHEAGHAVASAVLCVPFLSVSIIPDEEMWGHVRQPAKSYHQGFDENNPTDIRGQVENLLLVSLAGQVAEARFTGSRNWGALGKEWREVLGEAKKRLGEEGKVLRKHVDYLRAKAETLFNPPWDWAAVEVVAKELLVRKTMDAGAIQKIVKKAWHDFIIGRAREAKKARVCDFNEVNPHPHEVKGREHSKFELQSTAG